MAFDGSVSLLCAILLLIFVLFLVYQILSTRI